MRVLVLLIALFSMPVLAADYAPWVDAGAAPAGSELLAQAAPQGQPQGVQPQGVQQQTGPQRHPGDYCTRHCRHNEIPCGDGCMKAGGNGKCLAKKTTACAGKP
jgi:hypothetical protein